MTDGASGKWSNPVCSSSALHCGPDRFSLPIPAWQIVANILVAYLEPAPLSVVPTEIQLPHLLSSLLTAVQCYSLARSADHRTIRLPIRRASTSSQRKRRTECLLATSTCYCCCSLCRVLRSLQSRSTCSCPAKPASGQLSEPVLSTILTAIQCCRLTRSTYPSNPTSIPRVSTPSPGRRSPHRSPLTQSPTSPS